MSRRTGFVICLFGLMLVCLPVAKLLRGMDLAAYNVGMAFIIFGVFVALEAALKNK